jgi:carbon-monoxide dehydrogenase small subunit
MTINEVEVNLIVNRRSCSILTAPHRTLLELLREDLRLTGAKNGCGQGDCGSCVVVMNGRAVNSCLVLAPQADGAEIVTVEGLAAGGTLHPLQRLFAEKWAFQCGYCTPGMLMSCYALLLVEPNPTEEEVRDAISGVLCRCASYRGVVDAVLEAAAEIRAGPVVEG